MQLDKDREKLFRDAKMLLKTAETALREINRLESFSELKFPIASRPQVFQITIAEIIRKQTAFCDRLVEWRKQQDPRRYKRHVKKETHDYCDREL